MQISDIQISDMCPLPHGLTTTALEGIKINKGYK